MTNSIAASPSFLRGFDISEFQPTVDWSQVAAAKYDFCFIRSTHGGEVDGLFQSHRAGAKSINLPAGFYHYLNPVVAVDTQVKNMSQTIGSFNPGDLKPVIDLEGATAWAPVASKDRLGVITQTLDGLKASLGVDPMAYLSLDFIKDVIADPSVDVSVLAKYDLWIAEYGLATGATPAIPSPWTFWRFWQFSSTGAVAGITGAVDLDYFNGSQADLRSMMVHPV
jgi:lysozyme